MTQAIVDYEEQKDDEAVFLKALDELCAMIHIMQDGGRSWKEWDIHRKDVLHKNDKKTSNSEEVSAIWKIFRNEIMKHPEWFNEGKA